MGLQQIPSKGGIPSGITAARPSSPATGDTFYDGTLGFLVIYDGTNWIPSSAPGATPTIAVADVGTAVAYGSAQAAVTITPSSFGGKVASYTTSSSTGGYSTTSSSTTPTVTVGNNGSYTFSTVANNLFGVSGASNSVTETLTTVPQAPTIGTAAAAGGGTDITVTWTLGSNGGKTLSSITITPYLNGTTAGTTQTAASISSTSHAFTGLTAGSSYTFKVNTTNANGPSAQSAATNSVTVPTPVTTDFLVIAGGGGGGTDLSAADRATGGGGAGGLRSSVTATGGGGTLESSISITSSFTVTVGAGGAQGAGGSSSVFSNITSLGGGSGGYVNNGGDPAGSGGSGGGSSSFRETFPGSGTANQGYAGANGTNAGPTGGGGGGGAGSVGGAGSSGTGGNGGNGVAVSITGSSVTYGGGGAGGSGQGTGGGYTGIGTGGNGGGGNGGYASTTSGAGGAGQGGGGGGRTGGNSAVAGTGGSGIVILRYPSAQTLTIGGGLTASTNASGNNKITTFNAGTGTVNF
jgi:hypothetical protein